MKKIMFTFCFGLLSLIASAQSQPAVTDPQVAKLDSLTKLAQRFINDNQVDSLYAIMGDSFKSQISPEKMKEVMGQLTGQLGKWTGVESRGINAGIARYKATFALAPLDFYISQDKQGKVETFLFKPLE
ncbi:DUF3887 domain-containing protein [Spirosoma rigui]|uniref:DUF3887 domain-containing protein n=1 Tax=Spirosoma rigui TaxID=564064 RepID=UPI0009B0B254|nr:DUF3887 domain-containing protein [Spirosoma rigui]